MRHPLNRKSHVLRISWKTPVALIIFIVFVPLLQVFAVSDSGIYDVQSVRVQMERDLTRALQHHESRLPKDAYLPNGRVNTNHPEYAPIRKAYVRDAKKIREHYKKTDTRYKDFQHTVKEVQAEQRAFAKQRETELTRAGKGKEYASKIRQSLEPGKTHDTGSKPKTPDADMDFAADKYSDAKKIADAFKKKGYTVKETADAFKVKETDTVIWKPKGQDPIGSSAREGRYAADAKPHSDKYPTEGGLSKTSKGKVGRGPDPEGYVLANIKKASDAGITNLDPRSINPKDLAKSVDKAGRAVGREQQNPEFYKKTENLRGYQTPEEAGVVTFGDPKGAKMQDMGKLQQQGKSELKSALETAKAQSSELNAQRTEAAKEHLAKGNREAYTNVRETQIATKASNEVTMKELARTDPALIRNVTGIDHPTTPAGREQLANRTSELTGEMIEVKGPNVSTKAPVGDPTIGGIKLSNGLKEDFVAATGKVGTVVNGIFVAGLASSAIRQESEAAAKEGRDFSTWEAGKNVLKDTVAAPFEVGRQASIEELSKVPEEVKKRKAALESIGLGGVVPDSVLEASAKLDALGNAKNKALGEIFFEGPRKMSQGILEEEALAEYEAARAAGEEVGLWRTAQFKGRAAVRIAGEFTMMNPIFDAVTYDSDAERQAAEMKRKLSEYTKSNLEEGLIIAEVLQGDIDNLLENGNLGDPAVQERLNNLRGQDNTARNDLVAIQNRMGTKVDLSDPKLVALNDAVTALEKKAEAKEKAIQRAIEEARKKAAEERRKAEEEARQKAAEEERQKAEEEARRKTEEANKDKTNKDVVGDNRGVGGPEGVDNPEGKPEAGADELYTDEDSIKKLRGAEKKTTKLDKSKKKSAKGEKEGIELAKGINVTDSFDKERSGKSKNESQEAQTGAGATLSERAGASKAQHEREKGKIDAQGQETDRAISETQKEHTTAQQTAQQDRQTSIGTTIATAVAGGLTSGVAAGLDNLFGGVGKGAGQQTSSDIGVIKKSKKGQGPSPSGSSTTAGTGTASQTPPAQGTGSGTKTQDQPGPEVKPDENKDRGGITAGGVKSRGTRRATCECAESNCRCNKPPISCSLMNASECKTKTVTRTTGRTSTIKPTTIPGNRPGRYSGGRKVRFF